MIKKNLHFLLVLIVVGLFGSIQSPSTQAAGVGNDNWVPASSVGMGNNNYAAFTAYTSGPSNPQDIVCFGGWAHSQTDSVVGCNGDNTTYGSTMFDSSEQPHTELHVARIPAFPNGERPDTLTANAYFRPEARPTYQMNRLYRTGHYTQSGFALEPSAFYEDYNPPNVYNVNKISGLIWYKNNLYMSSWSPSTRNAGGTVVEASQGLEIWKHPPFNPNSPFWTGIGDSNADAFNIVSLWQRVINAGNGSTNNEGVMHMFVHNNTLYASVYNHGDNPKFLKTTDGTNWSWVDTDIPGNNNYAVSHVTYQGKLVVGLANGGVYSADDNSLTNWTKLNTQTGTNGLGHALVVSRDGKTLYAGGRFNGSVYKSIENAGFELSKSLGSSVGVYSLATTGNRVWAGVGNIPFLQGSNANTFYYDNARSARVWCLGCQAAPPPVSTLEIELPPTNLIRLQSFKFGGYVCDMSLATFDPNTCNNDPQNTKNYKFSRETIDDYSGNLDDRYIIRVTGFQKGDGLGYAKPGNFLSWLKAQTTTSAFAPPPASTLCAILPTSCTGGGDGTIPYGYQVTFNGGNPNAKISPATVSTYRGYLLNNALSNAFLGSNKCDPGAAVKDHLCLKSFVELSVPEKQNIPALTLIESIKLPTGGSIEFEGNVAGGGTLNNFGFTNLSDPKAVAVGGTVNAQVTNKISNYVAGSSKLGWSDVYPELNNLYAKRDKGTSYTPPGNTYGNATWNLNSNSSSPVNTIKSSFSTPPEGKLWHVEGGNVTFTSANTFFNGRGTLVVDGDVTFNGNVSCQNGQVGIIASGSITFRGDVNCGAFTALGQGAAVGNITFTKNVVGTSDWTGIFVAENNIDLPNVTSGTLTIHYNTQMANDPTVLFKELLGIIFSTDS